MSDFINLMVTELQNQDPTEPMDNSEILNQMSQIREISSNDRLSETLDAVLLGQNMATASNLIGQTVNALSDAAEKIAGTVDRVSIEDGVAKLHVVQRIPEHYDPETLELVAEQWSEHTVSLRNVSQVLPDNEDTALLAQKLSAAGSLVGQTIVGVSGDAQVVTGQVDDAMIEEGTIKLKVGEHTIDLESVTQIVGEGEA